MKIRSGFVSNSSSCSFTIPLNMLTDKMVNDIIDPEKKSLEVGHLKPGEFDLYWGGWSIRVNTEAQQLTGYTTMDNFGMYEYLEKLGLDMDKIDIDDDNRW